MPTIRDTLLHSYLLHGSDLYRASDFGSGVEPIPHYIGADERDETATHVSIPSTGWGDYAGDDVTRSNHRSILRDLPDLVTEVTGWYGYTVLVIGLDVEVEEHVEEWLTNLLDYPVWDESDWSDLTMELEQEAWSDYGADDLRREVKRQADRALPSTEDVARVEDYVDALTVEEWNTLASDVAYARPEGHPQFVVETGGSGYWDGADGWAHDILLRVFEVMDAEDTPAEWQPVPVVEGQDLLGVTV
jgi:hypothetical protein